MKRPAHADARSLAAKALCAIVEGRSLRAEYEACAGKLSDPRDRALLSALLHAGTRWWLRYAAAVDRLLEHPLPAREAPLRALLVLGLVQVEALRLPAYAAVDASVESARTLGRPKFAALVNAVLRRWLREREALLAELDRDPVTRTAHPRWLLDAFAADWPDAATAIAAADNAEAPLWLRVNRRRIARFAYAQRLAEAGIEAGTPAHLADAVMLAASADVTGLPGFAEGLFSVQDGAAQCAVELLDPADGQRILDACAAPGGKSAHVLERADVRLLALDADEQRLPRLRQNLDRLGLHADVRAGDAAQPQQWWDGRPFDRILVDAPCSATGIIRRQPDVRLHRREADIPVLVRAQSRLLEALWPLLARDGRLVYATCSVLAAENAGVIARFLAVHGDATPGPRTLPGWREVAGGGMQNLPGESGMDGFYYAVLEKNR